MMWKWQNLLKKKCPHADCDGTLQPTKDRAILYTCSSCDFVITRRKYAEILSDPNHILRRFLTTEELYNLDEAIKKSYATN